MAEMSASRDHPVMRRLTIVACVALVASLLSPPARAGKVVVFEGGGWGHGLGMSQYGAYGRALNDVSSNQILQHYYSGTRVRKPAGVPSRVRVGLLQAQAEILIRSLARTSGGGAVEWRVAGSSTSFARGGPAASWRVVPSGVGGVKLFKNGTLVKKDGKRVFGSTTKPVLLIYEKKGSIARVLDTGRRYAYGRLEFGTYKSSSCSPGYCARLVLRIGMQKYLYGLGEMPSSWPAEALEAQAITGRTYAARRVKTSGQHRVGCDCALYDSPVDQAYIGDAKRDSDADGKADTYWPKWKGAVDRTKGQVLMYNGGFAQTLYSSSSGGHTEHNENVWGSGRSSEAIPYLRGVPDRPDRARGANPNYRWTTTVSWGALESRMNSYFGTGRLKRFRLVPPLGVSGRVTVVRYDGGGGVKIVGSRRTARVDGWDIRSALGLRDTLFSIDIRFTVDSRLLSKYRSLDGAPGEPTTDVYKVPRSGTARGVAQNFQKGRLTYRSKTGRTVWQYGRVLRVYDNNGREGGKLKMPTSDVFGGRFKAAHYVRGTIVTSSTTGNRLVMRRFARTYKGLGGPKGYLRLPTSNRLGKSSVAPGGRQLFQRGTIYRDPASGRTYGLWGRIDDRYVAGGGGSGPCGLPTANMKRTATGFKATFQHGTITQTGDSVKVACG
ncbi:MAG: SpoIID/LytB domain-containing protein [Actinobacteria bacterium]|nr:SpoIID/LytB domain-containing protein [Actinomycetota bacterium]